jgi:hypothetical protein
MPLKPHPTDPDKMVYVSREYKLPKPWAGLTDEEIDLITGKIIGWNSACGWEADYARAIEAKLKERNT